MIARANGLRQRLRFLVWKELLRLQLRRRGARLVVEAPLGARFDTPPRVRVHALGDGDGTTTVRLGRGVSLGSGTSLDIWAGGTNRLEMGEGAYLLAGVRLELRGGSVVLGPHTHVRDGAVLKSQGELTVGREVTISFHDVLACTRRIDIGDFAGLGERVTVTDSDHTHDGSDRHYLGQPLRIAPVRIGRNVLVSANAVVLRGAQVGDNALIAAGSVVTGGDHPGGHLLAGAPARAVKPLGPGD